MNITEKHDIRIHGNKSTTIRELKEGDYYITITNIHRGKTTWKEIRQRTADPFKSKTLMGSDTASFPSTKVYIVTLTPISERV